VLHRSAEDPLAWGEIGSEHGEGVLGSHMDYVATEFLPLSDLPTRTADLIRAHLSSDAAWEQLAAQHNDRAAALLAVCGALSRTLLKLDDGRSIGGLELVSEINLLAGDRAYLLLDRGAFDSWRDGEGQFAITRADGSVESGKVGFNRGGTGGSLHEGFDIQGITGNRDVPRIQWNYRHCDGLADIDVDGYAPWDIFHHLTYANSDVRQWYAKYVSKFGQAPFKVKKVGGVEPDEVKMTRQCPLPHDQLTDDERARAVEQARVFSSLLESSGDFRAAVDGAADRRLFVDVLRSPRMSPLIGIVAPALLEQAPPEALRDYYLARANVQLSQIDASEGLRQAMRSRRDSTADAALGALAEAVDSSSSSLAEPIESLDQLARARRSLEADEQAGARLSRELAHSRTAPARAEREPAVWLTRDPHATADPRLVRAVAVELPNVRLILVRDGSEFRVASAVPWGPAVKPD
jgi:hypothetical protein